jgi:hypothetical protein
MSEPILANGYFFSSFRILAILAQLLDFQKGKAIERYTR